MANCNESSSGSNSLSTKNVTSVSAGGESVSIDVNASKAEDRDDRNQCLVNQANRRVRPVFGIITGGRP